MLQMIRRVHNCCLCRNSSHVLMLPRHSTFKTKFGISNKKIATHDTVESAMCPLFTLHIQSLSALLTQNIEYLLSNKFESCIQDKCCKPHNQIKHFSRTCFSKTMIISNVIDFTKAISCSGITHVSIERRLAVIFDIFRYLNKKCYKSTQNLIFFQYFMSLVAIISIG